MFPRVSFSFALAGAPFVSPRPAFGTLCAALSLPARCISHRVIAVAGLPLVLTCSSMLAPDLLASTFADRQAGLFGPLTPVSPSYLQLGYLVIFLLLDAAMCIANTAD